MGQGLRLFDPGGMKMRVILLTLFVQIFLHDAASAQAWRNRVPNSIGPGGCDSIGPGGGQSIGPGGGLSIGPGGGLSIGPGGGQSIGPGGGQSIGPGGGQALGWIQTPCVLIRNSRGMSLWDLTPQSLRRTIARGRHGTVTRTTAFEF